MLWFYSFLVLKLFTTSADHELSFSKIIRINHSSCSLCSFLFFDLLPIKWSAGVTFNIDAECMTEKICNLVLTLLLLLSRDSLTFSPPVILSNWHWPINQWSFVFWIRTCLSDKMAQLILEKQACQLWPWPIGVKENLAQDAATPGQDQVHYPTQPAFVLRYCKCMYA